MSYLQNIEFESDGVVCRGSLSSPSAGGRSVTVVMCPGLGGTSDSPNIQRAIEDLTTAGFGTFTFDYRSFGRSGGYPRQVATVAGQLADVGAAVSAASAHPSVDPTQVVLWGTSLGGAHAIVASSHLPVRAVVAQMPFVGVGRHSRPIIETARYLRVIAADRARQALGLTPHYVRIVDRPGRPAAIATPDADRVIKSFENTSWRNMVAAGVFLELSRYRPIEAVATVPPLLICVGENDNQAPREIVEDLAAQAPECELIVIPGGHFAEDDTEMHRALMAAQTGFLVELIGSE